MVAGFEAENYHVKAAVTGAAPLKDADSAAVFSRLLGMTEAEHDRLQAEGVTGVDHLLP